MKNKIGIIAGSGALPVELVKICIQTEIECYVAALDNQTYHVNYKHFAIGQVGEILGYFKKNDVEQIILAGSVVRPNLSSIKVDKIGASLLGQIIKKKILGDDALLKIVSDFIEKQKFKVIPATLLLGSLDYKILGKYRPSSQDKIDIEIGFNAVKKLGELDIGQSVIVENGYILGVEAAEGTDNLIKRCVSLRKRETGGVLIKALKSTQDLRFDIPTIGPNTILNLAKNHYNGIAIKHDEVIILENRTTFDLANHYKIFIASL